MIAQVKRMVARGTIKPLQVKVPGVLVDAVVVDPEQRQSLLTDYDPSLAGEYRVVTEDEDGRMPLTERKVIARRAAEELGENDVCNLGFGMPDGVAAVVKEERGMPPILSVEQGIIGGIPQGGSNFGLVRNPMAILDQPYQFDWYDGGGLDVTVLSFAQFDRCGNVNVSKFGGRINGVGGFINISQGAKKVVFVGTFTAGGFALRWGRERSASWPRAGAKTGGPGRADQLQRRLCQGERPEGGVCDGAGGVRADAGGREIDRDRSRHGLKAGYTGSDGVCAGDGRGNQNYAGKVF